MRPSSFRTWARTLPCAWCLAVMISFAVCRACGAAESVPAEEEHADAPAVTVETEATEPEPLGPTTEAGSPGPAEEPTSADSAAEPATPDEVFNSPAHPQMVTIDGADPDPKSEAETREDDPFPNGFSIRWLMPVDGFGITDLELSRVDHRPRFSDHARWNIDIPFAVHFVDEPQALGIPSELYSAQIETRWVQPVGDNLGFDVSVVPGWFSDFDSGRNNGFRVTGHGIATFSLSDEFKLALGVMYLGRDDVKILPAGGIVVTILPDTQIELLMPKPRISQRISSHDGWDQFVYAGFELFGGDSWAVTRPDNSYDTLTYRDFRFLIGHEVRGPKAFRNVCEIGYVFARKIEFRNSPETLAPGGTLLLRLGSSY